MKPYNYRTAIHLAGTGITKTIPAVKKELAYWKAKAKEIPNPLLREQALTSIEFKAFHCYGGGIYAMLAGEKWREAIRFIVAYQTISDYLDNLCDRSDLLDPTDFRSLHQSMLNIVTLSNDQTNYYQHREDQDDGGYLAELVQVCQENLRKLPAYTLIKNELIKLASNYVDLQVDKHVIPHERVDRLKRLFEKNELTDQSITWYEYAAAIGSTLTIFCLVSYGHREEMLDSAEIKQIYAGYFPYLQGLHILLDYLIDQEEDLAEGDLNFCFYYPDIETMEARLIYFIEQTEQAVELLPDAHFHRSIYQGLLALYLADPKVKKIKRGKELRRALLKTGGSKAYFYHYGIRLLRVF